MYELAEKVFISYRGKDYDKAELLYRWLKQNRWCKEPILLLPNSLCSRREVLLVFEYFELMEFIRDYDLVDSSAFMILDLPHSNYWEGIFTQLEVLYWRRLSSKNPAEVYRVVEVDKALGKPHLAGLIQLPAYTKEEEKIWASVSVSTNRSIRNTRWIGPPALGKYAESCYLICCAGCGEYILFSKKLVDKARKGNAAIPCPHNKRHTGSNQIRFREESSQGKYYRRPIIQDQEGTAAPRQLTPYDLVLLISDNKKPESIPLYTLPGEEISSNLEKADRFYTTALVSLGGILGLIWLINNRK